VCCVLTRAAAARSIIHDQLRIGDRLQSTGPFNAFPLNLEARHTVFIAGGIGITPLFTMMEALEGCARPFELHYSARDPSHLLPVSDYSGRTRRYPDGGKSRMNIDAILDPLPTDVDLYVCGPRRLIEAVRTKAKAQGWSDKRIHFESFGASLKPSDAPIKVRLELSGLSIEVPSGTAILDALLANGVWAPYECRRGECAACMTDVLSGEPDHRDICLTEEQRRHAMCTCVS